jgi:eukaryotic-like serine/threonine-protein kinase
LGETLQNLSQRPQLVILSDGQNAPQSSAPAWRKIAPALLRAGIPAVVITQAVLPHDSAYAFLRSLYEELVSRSGQADTAINAARAKLRPLVSPSPIAPLPILYTRTPTPHLFDQPPPALSEVKDEERRNQLILLRKVREYWVEGVYEQSLQEVTKIELGMETHLDASERTLTDTKQTDQLIPPGQRMIDLFDQLGGALLVLGAPGAGKTFALLELARDLIIRAERTPNHPLPVVFNLSSWQDSKQSIAKWMVEELSLKYFIPRKIGRRWVEDKKIMPLLDGLDEVKANLRADCVRAINTFHRENLVGLAVCSRFEEYEQFEAKLDLAGAVRLSPLTRQQIDAYLHRAGPELAAVRETLQHDEPLQELAETPLMLNVMALAYEGKSVEEIRGFDTVEARRRNLFDEYVRKMFNPKARKLNRLYLDEQTVGWLNWLAQKMQQHNQSEFLIEGLQPSWLSLTHLRWVYFLGSRLLAGFVIGIIFHITDLGGVSFSGAVNLPVSLVFGLTGGTFVGFIDGLRLRQFSSSLKDRPTLSIGNVLMSILIFSVGYGLYHWLISGLIFALIFWFHNVDNAWDKGFEFAHPVDGVIFGLLIFWPIFGLRGHRHLENNIQTVETLRWSFFKALRGKPFWLSNGLIIGSILGLFFALVNIPTGIAPFTYSVDGGETIDMPSSDSSNIEPTFIFILQIAGLGLFIGGVIGSIWSGFNKDLVKTKNIPNQGIWLSLKNAIIAGLIIGFAFVVGSNLMTINPEYDRLNNLRLIGFGILCFLWYGGLDIIQHYILRFLLWQKGYTPRNYARFLDYAAERIFLRKVGGGYIFIHRLLQEHFAGLYIEQGSGVQGGGGAAEVSASSSALSAHVSDFSDS